MKFDEIHRIVLAYSKQYTILRHAHNEMQKTNRQSNGQKKINMDWHRLLFLWIGAHFSIILDFWFGSARSQRYDSTILKCERNHLATLAGRQ